MWPLGRARTGWERLPPPSPGATAVLVLHTRLSPPCRRQPAAPTDAAPGAAGAGVPGTWPHLSQCRA